MRGGHPALATKKVEAIVGRTRARRVERGPISHPSRHADKSVKTGIKRSRTRARTASTFGQGGERLGVGGAQEALRWTPLYSLARKVKSLNLFEWTGDELGQHRDHGCVRPAKTCS